MPRILTALLLAIPLLLVAALGAVYLHSPPQALNLLNDLTPGDGGVERVATSIPFAPGPRGMLDVWAKPAPATAKRPVLIFWFGGAWVKGRRQDYAFVAKAYSARGFVVVLPDYRLVPTVRFPAFVQDGAAAVKWTRDNIARFGGDPNRIVLSGHSAGAYIAVMLALDQHYLRDIDVNPGVIRAVAGLAGPYDFYPFTSPRSQAAMGAWPDWRQTQPVTFARTDAPPLWLVTGTADEEVRPRNARSLARRQHELGSRTTELREYPGRNHNDLIMAVSKPFRGRVPLLEESIAFFARAGVRAGRD